MGYKIYLTEKQTKMLLGALLYLETTDCGVEELREIEQAIANKLDCKEQSNELPHVEEWWPDDLK